MSWACRVAWVVWLAAVSSVWGQQFTPALDVSALAHRARVPLEVIEAWGEGRGGDDAAALSALRQLRPLLRSEAPVVLAEREGVVETVAGAVRRWPASWAGRLARLEEAESAAEWSNQRGTVTDPAELVRLAHRWGPTRASGEALAEAARRSALRGDLLGAEQLAGRAKALGVAVDVPRVRWGVGAESVPVLASYWWFDKMPDRLGGIRSVPVVLEGGRVALVSGSHVVCVEPGGGRGVVRWVTPELPGSEGRRSPMGPGRLEFPVFGGVESMGVLVVRQGWAGGGGGILRALRGSDGAVIWSSEEGGETAVWHMASLPSVAGRYVYVLASEAVASRAYSVSLLALELTSGRLLWRARLGELSEMAVAGRGRERGEALGARRAPGLWDEGWSPLVVGDRVMVAAGGAVFALDRFDGTLLGAGRYPSVAGVAREGAGPSESAMSRWGASLVAVGETVVAAPRDADGVFGFDLRTLVPKWRQPRLGGYGLVGVGRGGGDEVVVLQGSELMVLDAEKGVRGWQTAPRTQTRWTGPAVVVGGEGSAGGEVVVVPTSVGTAAVSVRTGQWLPSVPVTVVELNRLMTGEVAGVLAAADVLRAFLSSGAIGELLPGRGGGDAEPGGMGPERVVPGPSQPARQTPRGPIPPPRVEPPRVQPQRSGG